MTPETMHDAVFGELFYDPPLEQWWADVALTPEHRIEITIWWDEATDGPFAPVLDRARAAYLRFQLREPELRHALAIALMECHAGWAPPDGEAYHPDAVARGLTASEMSIRTDGSARVIYDDAAELFGDHYIVARIGRDGDFVGSELHG
jgi:hypothetical protein